MFREPFRVLASRPFGIAKTPPKVSAKANADHGPASLFKPSFGVPSHPQPLLSHLPPVFFLDVGPALLCLQMTAFRAISIFLRLGRPVHGAASLAPPPWQSVCEANGSGGSLRHRGKVEPSLVEQRQVKPAGSPRQRRPGRGGTGRPGATNYNVQLDRGPARS
jgi:hypothetical protein